MSSLSDSDNNKNESDHKGTTVYTRSGDAGNTVIGNNVIPVYRKSHRAIVCLGDIDIIIVHLGKVVAVLNDTFISKSSSNDAATSIMIKNLTIAVEILIECQRALYMLCGHIHKSWTTTINDEYYCSHPSMRNFQNDKSIFQIGIESLISMVFPREYNSSSCETTDDEHTTDDNDNNEECNVDDINSECNIDGINSECNVDGINSECNVDGINSECNNSDKDQLDADINKNSSSSDNEDDVLLNNGTESSISNINTGHHIRQLVIVIETWIDKSYTILPKLTKFIRPGTSSWSTDVHICRAECRRAERSYIAMLDIHGNKELKNIEELLCGPYTAFMNRLSDFLFVIARYDSLLNDEPTF